MSYPVKIDLHMHTVLSDGTDNPEEMPARAAAEPKDTSECR